MTQLTLRIVSQSMRLCFGWLVNIEKVLPACEVVMSEALTDHLMMGLQLDNDNSYFCVTGGNEIVNIFRGKINP